MQIFNNITDLLGDDLKKTISRKAHLRIAASCFTLFAYEALKKELAKIDSLHFLFTEPAFAVLPEAEAAGAGQKFASRAGFSKKDGREFLLRKAQREHNLYGTEFEIYLRNRLTQRAIARECAAWIRSKARFKSNITTKGMPGFLHIANAGNAAVESHVYQPLNGFSSVELGYQRGNAFASFVNRIDEKPFADQYLQMFDTIWQSAEVQDVTEAVCAQIETVYRENAPRALYFHLLYNIFREFLDDIDEDNLPNDATGYKDSLVWNKLFSFQRDAAMGIINRLETHNGCILADSVGLGKTFTALAVIKYYELRNRAVLVLCPKKLADNWRNYNANLKTNLFAKDRFNYDVLCHTDLSRSRGQSLGLDLSKVNWGNYDLVVIDESHNFRNNEAVRGHETRYQQLMNKVIKAGVKTKVLMLSATPVNNRFTDLRNQLALAYEGDSENLSRNLPTKTKIEDIFRQAQAAFNIWAKLPPEKRTGQALLSALDFDFFELLDAVTIARSRKHIETFYNMAEIGRFPERLKPLSFRCPITETAELPLAPSLEEIFTRLQELKLAIYAPLNYVLPSRLDKYEALYDTEVKGGKSRLRQRDRERSLQGLMTTNLLKRLESSVEAFRLTLQNLESNISAALDKIAAFEERQREGAATEFTDGELMPLSMIENRFDEEDSETLEELRLGGKVKIDPADMDILSWQAELLADRMLIRNLLAQLAEITPRYDAKLQHLRQLIAAKQARPLNRDAAGRGNRKLLIFTAFADTAHYLYNHLAPELLARHGLHSAVITGSGAPKTNLKKTGDIQELLTLFSPKSKEKDKILPDEPGEIDILFATDCISEGQNLQDCDYLVNYDIHWNPVRIIQRFGRIDRIGSENAQIQLVNYWPDISLDEYINLKERVENRMMLADAVGTGDDNVLTAKSSDIAYRKEQLKRLQTEVIEIEDVRDGISITDLGLNDFRMDILNYIKENGGKAPSEPNGMHALVPVDPQAGLYPGVIFALRNIHAEAAFNKQNRLHPYYLVYISESGEVLADYSKVKQILDLARAACRHEDKPFPELCRRFNARTQDGYDMSRYSELLSQAIHSMIEIKEEKDIDSLFSGEETTALNNVIKGADDFELIGFIVIEGEAGAAGAGAESGAAKEGEGGGDAV